jgi:hypothetical protein
VAADSVRLIAEDQVRAVKVNETMTLARRLERAWVINLIVVLAGLAALGFTRAKSGFNPILTLLFFCSLSPVNFCTEDRLPPRKRSTMSHVSPDPESFTGALDDER